LAGILVQAIVWFCDVVTMLLLLRALLSWFAQGQYATISRIYELMVQITEPIVAPCRQLLSRWNTGVIDFSVLLAFFLVRIVERLLVMLISLIF
jgi:YggT family protein